MKQSYKGLGVLSVAIGATIVAISLTSQAAEPEVKETTVESQQLSTPANVAKGEVNTEAVKVELGQEGSEAISTQAAVDKSTWDAKKAWSHADQAPPGLYFKSETLAKEAMTKAEPETETKVDATATVEGPAKAETETEAKVDATATVEEPAKAGSEIEAKLDATATVEEPAKAEPETEAKLDATAIVEEPAKAEPETEAKLDATATVEESAKTESETETKLDATATVEEPAKAEPETEAKVDATATVEESAKAESETEAKLDAATVKESAKAESEVEAKLDATATVEEPAKTEVKPTDEGAKQFIPLEADVALTPVDDTKIFPKLDANGMLAEQAEHSQLDPSKAAVEPELVPKVAKPTAVKVMPLMASPWMFNSGVPRAMVPSPDATRQQQGWNYPQGAMPQKMPAMPYPYMVPNRMPYYGYMPRVMYVPVYSYRRPVPMAKPNNTEKPTATVPVPAPVQQGAKPTVGN